MAQLAACPRFRAHFREQSTLMYLRSIPITDSRSLEFGESPRMTSVTTQPCLPFRSLTLSLQTKNVARLGTRRWLMFVSVDFMRHLADRQARR